jgi:hypothetical protein
MSLPTPDPLAPRGRRVRPEVLAWGIATIVVNVLVLIAIGVLIPVFARMAEVHQVPRNYRYVFYAVAALAAGNAIRRVVMQRRRLRRPDDERDDDDT